MSPIAPPVESGQFNLMQVHNREHSQPERCGSVRRPTTNYRNSLKDVTRFFFVYCVKVEILH
jgi:hypothetical protein